MNIIGLDLLIDRAFEAIDEWYEDMKVEIVNSPSLRAPLKYQLRSKRNEMELEFHNVIREFTSYTEMNPYRLDEGLNDDDKGRLIEEIHQFFERHRDVAWPIIDDPDCDFFTPASF